MLQQRFARKDARQGAFAPMAALLVVVLLAMVAFTVDMGYIVLSQSELQNAADAAALAGAGPLMDGYVTYNLPGQTTSNKQSVLSGVQANARAAAKKYAGYNAAGGVSSLVLLDSDIEFGYTDAGGKYTALPTYTGYPNTLRVVLRRSTAANGKLRLYFAPVLGMSSVDLTATAGTTLYGGSYDSFSSSRTLVGILPVTYDVNSWNNFIKTGKDADGKQQADSSGNPILQVYPSVKDTGNFGLLGLDDAHAGASELRSWIENGLPSSGVKTLQDRNLIPLSKHPNVWDWLGDTGMKASVVMDINDYNGKTFVMPLFTPYKDGSTYPFKYDAGTGNGSHYNYNIVQFVGVKIVSTGNKVVQIQPAAVANASGLFLGGPTIVTNPASGSSALMTTFAPPKLTR